nr:hypothetical protein [Gemmatimonadota bacterium]NIR78265.1 hypothetical protein [Gemmatimonadota bacterium]NIT86847.1 hypothetical protein [Gemmatimonadota bacterium]NIU30715.1 hypothetical protein [Gemmatimonadota bacterium]NIU35512.1 hypothetical protein [Gemmatimonadota bacterium]
QGLFIRVGSPRVVGEGAVLRVACLVVVALLTVGPLGHLGAALGVALHALGLLVEGVYLERRSHRRVLPALTPASASSGGSPS